MTTLRDYPRIALRRPAFVRAVDICLFKRKRKSRATPAGVAAPVQSEPFADDETEAVMHDIPASYCGLASCRYLPRSAGVLRGHRRCAGFAPLHEFRRRCDGQVPPGALYSRLRRDVTTGLLGDKGSRYYRGYRYDIVANQWDFPLLLKYRVARRRFTPFAGAGATLRHLGEFSGQGSGRGAIPDLADWGCARDSVSALDGGGG